MINCEFIKSPLNYTGGKYKILSSLFEYFPTKIDTFVDLFAGGFNVGINITANKIYCNDHNKYLIDLFEYFNDKGQEKVIKDINNRIEKYALSLKNETGYLKLREKYNKDKNIKDFFVLVCYSFNHQIRFNNSHEFNTPFGKDRSSFNKSIESNLIKFIEAMQSKNIVYCRDDFNCFNYTNLNKKDFIYCDPPYLITNGSYNDGKRGFKDWTEKEENELLKILDFLDKKHVKFALSNVLEHKGIKNEILNKWCKNYNIHYINKKYSNCSYHFKDRNTKTIEVLITNY